MTNKIIINTNKRELLWIKRKLIKCKNTGKQQNAHKNGHKHKTLSHSENKTINYKYDWLNTHEANNRYGRKWKTASYYITQAEMKRQNAINTPRSSSISITLEIYKYSQAQRCFTGRISHW